MRNRSIVAVFVAILLLASLAAIAGDVKIETITAEALHARLAEKQQKPMIVDVREREEFERGHIAGALLAPLMGVEEQLQSVPRDREIVLVCRSGRRSGIAYGKLAERGFTNMKNMEGGMVAWEKLEYPVVKP